VNGTTRLLEVVAQDPGIRRGRHILTAKVSVPVEPLLPGPVGHRVQVVDYDSTTRTFYRRAVLPRDATPGERLTNERILHDPGFHAGNVYALVMSTLGRFEFALGRRVSWGFSGHQLKVVPHAFEAANAFYSPESEALLFGYFRAGRGVVFTCLSHDIVVHETTHALLHGLRARFLAPSSPDQAAFHEGFADIVALLSVFSLREVLAELLDHSRDLGGGDDPEGLIHRSRVTEQSLRRSVLFGLAEEMEPELAGARVNALRRSVDLEPDARVLSEPDMLEPHRRGEVLVAAVMRAFLTVWSQRLTGLGLIDRAYLDRERVAEEGATVADQLLTMMIRAIDYTPPIHLRFGDFLSAVLTADSEVRADDSKFHLRDRLREWFGRYGIVPAAGTGDGRWAASGVYLARAGVRFGSLQTDPTEMFRLIWANRDNLRLEATAYTRVANVRPSQRISPDDGLPVRETVAECTQYLSVTAAELPRYRLRAPAEMPEDQEVVLEGGSTLVLDEYGMLKYEIHNRLPSSDDEARADAQDRIDYLWDQGYYDAGSSAAARLSTLHRRRAWESAIPRAEAW
jgi:hypothetical protein